MRAAAIGVRKHHDAVVCYRADQDASAPLSERDARAQKRVGAHTFVNEVWRVAHSSQEPHDDALRYSLDVEWRQNAVIHDTGALHGLLVDDPASSRPHSLGQSRRE